MISAYRSCAEFIRQAKKAGMKSQAFNVSFVGTKSRRAGKDLTRDKLIAELERINQLDVGGFVV